jgi:hypothetical protein
VNYYLFKPLWHVLERRKDCVRAPIIDDQEIDDGFIIVLLEAILDTHSKRIIVGVLSWMVSGHKTVVTTWKTNL